MNQNQGEPKTSQMWLSPARLPKFDSTLEILAPRQGRAILLFLTACAVFPPVHSGQSAQPLALVPGSLVCCQIWVTGQVIAISASSWAYRILLLLIYLDQNNI